MTFFLSAVGMILWLAMMVSGVLGIDNLIERKWLKALFWLTLFVISFSTLMLITKGNV